MIDKVVNVLKYRIRRREKLDEMADSFANTCRDDTENHECDQKPKRAYKLKCVYIGHINAGPYESAEHNKL